MSNHSTPSLIQDNLKDSTGAIAYGSGGSRKKFLLPLALGALLLGGGAVSAAASSDTFDDFPHSITSIFWDDDEADITNDGTAGGTVSFVNVNYSSNGGKGTWHLDKEGNMSFELTKSSDDANATYPLTGKIWDALTDNGKQYTVVQRPSN